MKTLKLTLVAAAMLVGGMNVKAQSADEIMTKHAAAMGGDSWKKINSMKTTASMSVQGMELEIVETVVRGKGARQEMSLGGQSAGYSIVTPTSGWKLDVMSGDTKAKEMPADELKAGQDQLDPTDEYVDYKTKGIKAEFVAKEDINGKSAFKLKLTGKDGKSKTTYFDGSSYYKVRETESVETPQGAVEVTTDFSEFKKFDEGVVISMKAKNAFQEITVKEVQLNKPVDEAIFKP